jgi:hypothetical protein
MILFAIGLCVGLFVGVLGLATCLAYLERDSRGGYLELTKR